jgi:hypothetical protein
MRNFFLGRNGGDYCLKNRRKPGRKYFVLGLKRKIFRARFGVFFSLPFCRGLAVAKMGEGR